MTEARGNPTDGDQGSANHGRARQWVAAVVVTLALVGALTVIVSSDDDRPTRDPSTGAPVGPLPHTTDDVADPTVDPGPLRLGTVTDVVPSSDSEGCPLDTCLELTVACPGLPETNAVVADSPVDESPRGLVAFFSGGPGRAWWATDGNVAEADVLAQLGSAGLDVVMVRWVAGWAREPEGQPAGFASLACRPATVVRWLHDERYAPMGLSPAPGTCGFCISGNSGGASQAAYSLTHYELATIVDAAILTSGPPHAALAKGCLRNPGDEAYWYDARNAQEIDSAYGAGRTEGACATHDPDMEGRWTLDSVDTGGSDYTFDATRIAVILGADDATVAPAHARDFVARLQASGSPWVTEVVASHGSHGINSSREGRQLLLDTVLGAP